MKKTLLLSLIILAACASGQENPTLTPDHGGGPTEAAPAHQTPLSGDNPVQATGTPVLTASPDNPPAPLPTFTTVPTPTVPMPERVLFADDFSDPSSGWNVLFRDEGGISDYEQEGFRIKVDQPNFDYWAFAGRRYTDSVIEVDAQKLGGPENNDFGLICRYRDKQNFYFFLAASDGYFAIGKYGIGGTTLLGSDSFVRTDLVRAGNSQNRLRADCVGSTLSFFINGELAARVEDSEHPAGDVGIIAGTFETPGTDILFDNFVVFSPYP